MRNEPMGKMVDAAVDYLNGLIVIVQRHGNPDPIAPDRRSTERMLSIMRVLSSEGVQQAQDAAAKREELGYKPSILLASLGKCSADTISPLPCENDIPLLPELSCMVTSKDEDLMNATFRKLGYVPLAEYDQLTGVGEALFRWSGVAVLAIALAVAKEDPEPGDVVLIGCTPVLCSALALALVSSSKDILQLHQLDLGEAQQIVIEEGHLKHVL
ncbi:MAG: hypothetical protein WC750_05410 [Patescibacteria group bacterium]|jgi:hypothetical protein